MQGIATAPVHCPISAPDSGCLGSSSLLSLPIPGSRESPPHCPSLPFAICCSACHVCAGFFFFPSLFNLLSCLGFLLSKWQEKLPVGWLEPLSSKGTWNTLLDACSLRLPLGELSVEVSVARRSQEACTLGG